MSIFKDKHGDICIENATIFGKNFKGDKFGPGGSKGFCVKIESEEWAHQLEKEGCNIKQTSPRDPDEEPMFYTPVAVNYNERFNPNIYLYNGRHKTRMCNETVGELNSIDIEHVDLILHPRVIIDDRTKQSHIKLYVKTMHVTMEEDPFGDKYAAYDGATEAMAPNDDEAPF